MRLPHPVIPRRPLALEPKAALARVGPIGADDVERDLAQHRQVLRRIVLGHRAGVLAEVHVEDPVKPVLHAPTRSHRGSQLLGGEGARGDVVAPLQIGFLFVDHPHGIDAPDRDAVWPVARIDDALGRQHRSDLPDGASVAALDQRAAVDRLDVVLVDEGDLDRFEQLGLVALDHQQVVALFRNYHVLAVRHIMRRTLQEPTRRCLSRLQLYPSKSFRIIAPNSRSGSDVARRHLGLAATLD